MNTICGTNHATEYQAFRLTCRNCGIDIDEARYLAATKTA